MTPSAHDREPDNALALLALKIAPYQFDLNRGLSYISMRDQILRARTLVESAVRADIFTKREESTHAFADGDVDYDLVVVGAGVGGISAALAAAENGLRVLIVEKSARPFSLLRSGTDRLLSGTVYDWPASHFDAHSFPSLPHCTTSASAKILKFPSSPVSAATLADHFEAQLSGHAAAAGPNLAISYTTTLSMKDGVAELAGRRLLVRLPTPITTAGVMRSDLYARVVIFAVGFGSEKTASITGVDSTFWGYKTLEHDLAAIPNALAHIAIVGAGDGGLQEALRVAFRPENHDLSAAISPLHTGLEANGTWQGGLRDILVAEDNAARTFMWGYDARSIFSALDAVHGQVIEKMISDLECCGAITSWARQTCRSRDLQIHLYDKHLSSGRVYALNRFLCKLLAHPKVADVLPVKLIRHVGSCNAHAYDLIIDRSGFFSMDGYCGTADRDSFLRRSVFNSLPNAYWPVT